MERLGRWPRAALGGLTFLAVFLLAQWPFADFLMSPAARNRLFGTHYFAFADPAFVTYDPYRFGVVETGRLQFWLVMAEALVAAILGARLGIAWAEWMRRVRR